MIPDYSKYSIHELREVCANINNHKYPERYEAAKLHLESKLFIESQRLINQEKSYNKQASETLHVSSKAHLQEFFPTAITLILGLSIWAHFSIQQGQGWTGAHSILILIWFALALIPQLILHARYSIINNAFHIQQIGTSISISSKTLTRSFNWADIEKIDIYAPSSKSFGFIRFIPSENYSYGKIRVKGEKEEVTITSLLDQELLWLRCLKPSVTERHWRMICLV
ncbi:hypothetical protein [Thalassotalea mangrovi]|uniref:PH domain-containing protein n=1 Tax=Thalassotalea mangrovi TaxID=2572245 RepID=A0A4U1B2P5_9GAMM|nr:hypothetical protein [Thalassotalea mangrovi]TKB43806.1 hypothetical protein E8M12_13640 [Thalassotalea mangrovi]